ncbi:MAG: endopeptidase La [Clostridium sp.]|nr:endopeptidase La [Clostridium sp.]
MNQNKELPLIPLRGLTLFPYMVLHFDVGREKSIQALDAAMMENQEILLVTQKDPRVEDPTEEDIYEMGTICTIRQLLKLPGNTVRVLVEGTARGKVISMEQSEPYFRAKLEEIKTVSDVSETEEEALVRSVKDAFDDFIKMSGNMPPEALITMDDMDDSDRFSDMVCSFMNLKIEEKQELLEAVTIKTRLEKLLFLIKNELEILKIERKIGSKVKSNIDKSQRDYYLREQIRAIQEELGEEDETQKEMTRYQNQIAKAELPKEAKERALYELDRLRNSGPYSSEGGIIRTYIDWILELPWNEFTEDNNDITRAREVLDDEHYGLQDVKDRIIEYLAVKATKDSLKGPILCLVGPPGVGKTSIAKSVAHALDRNFVRMSLGGVRDEAEIRGHRRTYLGAIPGRIIYGMRQAKSSNPLFLLDEVDKMAQDFRGDPADALLEVLDGEQNSTFRDHYLELEYDLSQVIFITTANNRDTIPRPLLDRMEVIEVSGYTYEEKLNIAKRHLIPKELKEHGLKKNEIKFTDESIQTIIDGYTLESGVRNLERNIASVLRKGIAKMLETKQKSMTINPKVVHEFLGHPKFTYDQTDKIDKVGVVTGLAWTPYGGDILPIEVQVMEGSGKLELTSSLGDVMKESAKAAYSYIRSRAKAFKVPEDFYKTKDIHIHVPEGATPKDGPSAGITMATAMVSALANRKVSHKIAMTGEITLTGRVLPIGGLREKSLAAYRAGIRTIIIPKKNEVDLEKIPESIMKDMTFIPVANISEVIKEAVLGEK